MIISQLDKGLHFEMTCSDGKGDKSVSIFLKKTLNDKAIPLKTVLVQY